MLICGDALNELKKLKNDYIDMGVTSPPYNKQENKKGWLVKNVLYESISDKKNEIEYQKEQIKVLNELFRIIKPGGSFFYNHKIRWERGEMIHPLKWIWQSNWHLRQEIIWDRSIAANIRGWRFWQIEERIFWLYKPINNNLIGEELASKHALLSSIWRIRPENKNNHPAPFPLAIPLRCILSILNNNKGLIIDPYMGSGTTGVAAKYLDCDFIGIEHSKEYLENAKIRIQNYKNEEKIAQNEINLHIVKESFDIKKEKGKTKNRFKQNNMLFDI